MKPVKTLLPTLLGLTLLGALIVGAYIAFGWLIHLFSGLDMQVAAVICAAVVAVLFSAVMIPFIIRIGETLKHMERLRGKKAEVYRRLLAAWASALRQPANAGRQRALHMEDELQAAEQQLLLWGSRSVIKHYVVYQKQATPHEPHDPAVMPFIEKVLIEIRKDLGQSNVGLETGDVIELLLNHVRHDPESPDTTLHRVQSGHRLFDGVR